MTYKFISADENNKTSALWGTFSHDKEKMFLFVSYLLGTTHPEDFYIVEVETGKAAKLVNFAHHYRITKEDIKNH